MDRKSSEIKNEAFLRTNGSRFDVVFLVIVLFFLSLNFLFKLDRFLGRSFNRKRVHIYVPLKNDLKRWWTFISRRIAIVRRASRPMSWVSIQEKNFVLTLCLLFNLQTSQTMNEEKLVRQNDEGRSTLKVIPFLTFILLQVKKRSWKDLRTRGLLVFERHTYIDIHSASRKLFERSISYLAGERVNRRVHWKWLLQHFSMLLHWTRTDDSLTRSTIFHIVLFLARRSSFSPSPSHYYFFSPSTHFPTNLSVVEKKRHQLCTRVQVYHALPITGLSVWRSRRFAFTHHLAFSIDLYFIVNLRTLVWTFFTLFRHQLTHTHTQP